VLDSGSHINAGGQRPRREQRERSVRWKALILIQASSLPQRQGKLSVAKQHSPHRGQRRRPDEPAVQIGRLFSHRYGQ